MEEVSNIGFNTNYLDAYAHCNTGNGMYQLVIGFYCKGQEDIVD